MKRDWDAIRDVLIEVEALDNARLETIQYGPAQASNEPQKDAHGVLLWKAGFIEGADASDMDGDAILAQGLTWAGYDLLETIRSKAVWERIKAISQDKGIELTFDSVKALGKAALTAIIGN